IFDRLYQAHGDGHMAGLGLGLYVCRSIAEAHGGTIAAECPASGGTRFVIRLPMGLEAMHEERQGVPVGARAVSRLVGGAA
ncbi:MAG TPA: ATP-binding protein, partial [Chloroflexota bacterium]|nr:ATP-binding protein [Chloroflexota bacterium]